MKDSLLFITRLDTDIVKSLVYIELSKVLGILNFYNKLKDQ